MKSDQFINRRYSLRCLNFYYLDTIKFSYKSEFVCAKKIGEQALTKQEEMVSV